jgi:hypothetical protein
MRLRSELPVGGLRHFARHTTFIKLFFLIGFEFADLPFYRLLRLRSMENL